MKSLICCLGLSLALSASAQPVDFDKIIYPDEAIEMSFEERLVQLAWQNMPVNRTFEYSVSVAEHEVDLSKWSWLDDIGIRFNFNQFNIENGLFNSTTETTGNFFPWYNVGLEVNLGSFFLIPKETAIAKDNVGIAQSNYQQQKLMIRAELLTRYSMYKYNVEALKLMTQAYENANTNHLLLTQKFRNGEIELEQFSESANAVSSALEGKMIAERELILSKIKVEEMIGMPLEDVLR